MKGSVIAFITGFCLCLASSVGAQGKFPLKPEDVKDANDPLADLTCRLAVMTPRVPSSFSGMPEGLTGQVSVFTVRLGPAAQLSPLLFAPSPPVKLYIDKDADKDFSDETPVSGTPVTLGADTIESQQFAGMKQRPGDALHVYDFGPVLIPVTTAGAKAELKFRVLAAVGDSGEHALLLRYDGVRGGEVRLGEHAYRVVVADANCDGRFDGTVSVPVSGPSFDAFGIDLNGDGAFDMNLQSGDIELMPLPKMLCLNDVYYGIQVAPDGSAIALEKVEPKLGTLEMATPGVELVVLCDCGYQRLGGGEGKWRLPAGVYMLLQIGLKATDQAGDTWTLTGHGGSKELQEFRIAENQTTSLPAVGPPFTSKADTASMGDTLLLSFSLAGKADEQYSPGAVKNGKQLPPPKFEIADESGKVVLADTFQYG